MRSCWVLAAALCVLFLSGCSGAPFKISPETNSKPGVALRGIVHGGQQPISGASVYLYAAGTSGYGGKSVSELTAGTKDNNGNYYVTTDAGGNFTITGDYTCTDATAQVYIYAIGGNSGSGTNSVAGLMAALGSCSALASAGASFQPIWVNEVSTVATAYAIAGYATDSTDVSSSGTALAVTGVANAFATPQNLETLSTGVSLTITPGQNGTAPGTEINTLADIIAACINTNGSTASGMPCNTLFSNAKSSSGATPTDTASAAINIAHNPGANVMTLWELATANSPFQPILPSSPNDWTVGIEYIGCGLNSPEGLAVDAAGNVWVANYNGSTTTSALCEFSPLGVPASNTGFTGGGLDEPYGVAIDASGDVWATNWVGGASADGSLSEFASNGSPISMGPYGYTGGELSLPVAVAVDSDGNVWVANSNPNQITTLYDVSEFNSSGSNYADSPYSGAGLDNPLGIAVDTSNDIWTANGEDSISELSSSGSAISPSPSGDTGGGLSGGENGAYPVAIDASGDVWAASLAFGMTPTSLSKFSSSGTAISPSGGYTGGGLDDPGSISIDGVGHVWVGNTIGNVLSEFSSTGTALSPSTGFQSGALYAVPPNSGGMAIDGSGNIWFSNYYLEALTEAVGAAAPVVTPIVANLKSPYGAHAVNEP